MRVIFPLRHGRSNTQTSSGSGGIPSVRANRLISMQQSGYLNREARICHSLTALGLAGPNMAICVNSAFSTQEGLTGFYTHLIRAGWRYCYSGRTRQVTVIGMTASYLSQIPYMIRIWRKYRTNQVRRNKGDRYGQAISYASR